MIWIVYDKNRYELNRSFAKLLEEKLKGVGLKSKLVFAENIKKRKNFPQIAIMRTEKIGVAQFLEKKGVIVCNNSKVSEICNDKFKTYQFLKSNHISVLDTWLYDENSKQQFPVVVKSRFGHGGREVFLARGLEELNGITKKYPNGGLICQQLADFGKDKRVYVVGNNIVVAMLRQNNKDFRANFSLGGTALEVVLTKQEKQLVEKVLNCLYFDFAGIDIIYKNSIPYINEIEDIVGCRMVYQNTKIDIAQKYIEHIKGINDMKKNGFIFLEGDKKILVSAPHAVEQTRDGVNKFAEPETALFAKILNQKGYPTIIKSENVGDDANYDLDSPYKTFLYDYCKNNKVKFVLDLHQLSAKREMHFCLGTGDDADRNLIGHKVLAQKIKEIATNCGFVCEINNPYKASSERTISGFCLTKNIPSMQLEINSKLVSSYYNATQFDDVASFLEQIIEVIEKEVCNENIVSL
ncbi:MAG: ATP-grasp domain-containing protein [Clostridia bacterium]|nr:ATP-grasp domain-containing protein [Clostridia bacterium]